MQPIPQGQLLSDEMADLQLKRLRWSVTHAYNNSEFYRKRMDGAGVHPEEIRSLDDLRRLPFTDKSDIRDNYPFGIRAVPFEDIVRLHASSGTTGKRTVALYTRKDIDDWTEMFARCYRTAGVTPQDRVQITPAYGLWTAGISFQLGAERLGAMVIPVGPGNTDLQLELMEDFQTTVITGTSSYGLLLGEEVAARGLRPKLALRIGIFGSERWSDAMRRRIEELLGIESFDIIGMTELYGPGIGIDCPAHSGVHYWSDYFIFEIIDPATLEPVPPGEYGEIVATTLTKEAMPMIRYRTHDISRFIPGPCDCGSPYPRIDRILGRTDDMFKFHGVAIFPSTIDTIISQHEGVSSEYQIVLQRELGRDTMTIRVERDPASSLPDADITASLQQLIKSRVGVTVNIELVPHKALPRTASKTRRILDLREGN